MAEQQQDSLDVFEDALGSLFNHHQAATGVPGSKARWVHPLLPPRRNGDAASAGAVQYNIPPNSTGDTQLYAHMQWDAGKAMARCLVESSMGEHKSKAGDASLIIAAADLRSLANDEAILELGAGTGLPSLVCARLLQHLNSNESKQAARIVCTDYPSPPLVESLRKSVDGEKANVVVRGLDWADVEAGKEIRR